MIDFSKIKLIIWDLDDTFWHGTISEGNIIPDNKNIELIKTTTDCGVINSICSKNDAVKVNKELTSMHINDLFVFKSIDWTNKGSRVKTIVDDMHLRYPNVLFIDDNPTNRAEVQHFCPNIMVADIDILSSLYNYFSNLEKRDNNHSRLKQYKILEEKRNARQQMESTEDFLKISNIVVVTKDDCLEQIDRIADLIQRSNQLNFTKKRSTKNELKDLINDKSHKCAYVEVCDKYGEYGIVGFYATKDNIATHFVFSCRILGMGVEQYIYKQIGCPHITIKGDVASQLDYPNVTWINQTNAEKPSKDSKAHLTKKIVVRGPCDVSQVFSYIEESPNIVKEYGYVNEKGILIDQAICTTHAVEYLSFPSSIRDSVSIKKLPFYDKGMFATSIYDKDVDFVIFSTFTDPTLACYKEKNTGLIVCFSRAILDLTDIKRKIEYINSSEKLNNCVFEGNDLDYINNHFEYIGRIQPKQILENIDYIYSHLADGCKLILTLQSEIECYNSDPKYKASNIIPPNYDNKPRHDYNKELNNFLRQWAKGKNDVFFLDFNKYIKGQESFVDHISHFTRDVYYKMSQDLVKIINKEGDISINSNTSPIKYKIMSANKRIKSFIRKVKKRLHLQK